jgi:hypothetical protein
MDLKKIAAGAAVAGALGFAALGFGAGTAQADPHGDCLWFLPQGPGPGCLPPPGHLQKMLPIGPPGHWPVNPGWVNHW